MQESARKADTPTAGMHAGRRFGDVLVGMQADEELAWFFNVAGTQMVQPSTLASAFTGRSPRINAAPSILRRAEGLDMKSACLVVTDEPISFTDDLRIPQDPPIHFPAGDIDEQPSR